MFEKLEPEDQKKVERIYKPEEVELYLDIYEEKNDDSKIMEVQRGFWGWLDRFLNGDKTYRKKRTVKINISTASPEKIVGFISLMIDDMVKSESGIKEVIGSVGVGTDMDDIYKNSIKKAVQFNNFSDEVIRFILGDVKFDDGTDFIPMLTISQRGLIIEAFWSVNPILNETQKKILKVGETLQEIQKTMDGVEKEYMKMENHMAQQKLD